VQILPWVGFYYRQHEQLAKLTAGGDGTALLDIATALEPVIKKHWPQLNENGLLDDLLATLQASEGP
jgi:hypothetical protein